MQAEKELVESFAELLPENTILVLDDVCLWLVELGETLDSEQTERVVGSIFSFLIKCENNSTNEGKWWWSPYSLN